MEQNFLSFLYLQECFIILSNQKIRCNSDSIVNWLMIYMHKHKTDFRNKLWIGCNLLSDTLASSGIERQSSINPLYAMQCQNEYFTAQCNQPRSQRVMQHLGLSFWESESLQADLKWQTGHWEKRMIRLWFTSCVPKKQAI